MIWQYWAQWAELVLEKKVTGGGGEEIWDCFDRAYEATVFQGAFPPPQPRNADEASGGKKGISLWF